MSIKLPTEELHRQFMKDLGKGYHLKSDILKKPILFSPTKKDTITYKAYIFNCTNPIGGRALDEYKIQLSLPGQTRGCRGTLNESDGTVVLIIGFAIYNEIDDGVWVIWETARHRSFAYKANLQVKLGTLLDVICKKFFFFKRPRNGEYVVLADRKYLKEAISLREEIDLRLLLEDDYDS